MRILGIDTGVSGAAAVLDVDRGCILDVIDVPTLDEDSHRIVDVISLGAWITNLEPSIGVIERAFAMPDSVADRNGKRSRMGSVSALRFGDASGTIRSAVIMSGVPYRLVMPGIWKKFFQLPGAKDKEASRLLAIKLWPGAEKFMNRKMDHNRAEAVLIAEYWRRTGGASQAKPRKRSTIAGQPDLL
jgi:hypothetical protein